MYPEKLSHDNAHGEHDGHQQHNPEKVWSPDETYDCHGNYNYNYDPYSYSCSYSYSYHYHYQYDY